ncbi:hypothetical protein [Chromobacterium paludis]|uniref:HNH endonuclease n=1 Tax=Chromobacterium paludis TaxID=2605945 RepID=A0A5C1DEK7_9NEIS|nr:hypothetical protein [Chromobacterium paludis]QEL55190.1 hypothetical protein FYK34_06230 [Chromobacterium paludis]
MIIEIHDIWDDAAEQHETFLRATVTDARQRELAIVGPVSPVMRAVWDFVDRNLNILVDAGIRDFTDVVNDFTTTFPPNSSLLEQAKDKFKRIFDYDLFRDNRVGWGAYSLCSLARYEVCPYCHIRATNTVPRDAANAGYRPQLDHFYDRARYPFLALSLGNLVPCCGTCNGPGMKHTKDFVTQPHLNPLCDVGVLSFELGPANGAAWNPVLRALREPAERFEVRIKVPAGHTKAANSLQTFQLRSQYQTKLRDAYRVAKLGCSPAFSRSAHLATGLDVHDMTISEHLGFDPNGDEYKNQSEGKMRRDVYLDSRCWLPNNP